MLNRRGFSRGAACSSHSRVGVAEGKSCSTSTSVRPGGHGGVGQAGQWGEREQHLGPGGRAGQWERQGGAEGS